MAFVNIPGNSNPIKVLSATGTGPGTTTFVHDLGVEGNYPGELYPAVFIFSITDIVGSFSALQVNLEWSPITPDVGAAQFQTVGTWTPLANPVAYFACSASGLYRLNCTSFTGGTSFNAYVSIASTMPQGTGGGGGGSVTQGTVPWIDNISQVAGVALGSTAVVAYGSTPAAVNVPGVNAFITNAGSIGGGIQFADNAVSGAAPTGTLAMGWDSVNSKIRAFKVDASQNLDVNINAALPAGTNVIGHVIVDSGSIGITGTVSAVQSGLWNVNQAIGVAGFEKITDGTNGPVAVKAASTAPVATDSSLVISFSPNSIASAITLSDTLANQTTVPVGAMVMGFDRAQSQWHRIDTFNQISGDFALQTAVMNVPTVTLGANSGVTAGPVSGNGSSIGVSPNVMLIAASKGGLAQILSTDSFGNLNVNIIGDLVTFPLPTQTSITPGVALDQYGATIMDLGVVNGSPISSLGNGLFGGLIISKVGNLGVVNTFPGSIPRGSVPSSLTDEYGNIQSLSEDDFPWRQALLDEIRAVRLGLQTLCRYINPGSGIRFTPNAPIGQSSLDSNEPDLISWAQSIRDGSDEVIQG